MEQDLLGRDMPISRSDLRQQSVARRNRQKGDSMSSYDPTRVGCQGGWRKFAGNPVLGEPGDFRFDNHVLRIGDRYRMYFSWRTHYSIAMTESTDGLHWSEPILVLQPRPES